MAMVVDAFLANDELELAKFRLGFLSPVVTKFYIGESQQTHQGRDKPLHFASFKNELLSLGVDIEVVEIPAVQNDSDMSARDREETQRDWFLKYVGDLHPNDVVLFTDIDEISSHEQVVWADSHLGASEIRTIPMQFSFRFANWLLEPINQDYRPGVMLRGKAFQPLLRNSDLPAAPGEKGAHLSYVGFRSAQLKEKFTSFSHTELDIKHLYQDAVLDFSNEWGIDHIGRPGQKGFGLLRSAAEAQLNSVLRAAINHRPDWFREFPRKSFLRRLVASSALSSYRSSGKQEFLDDPSRPVLSPMFLRHVASIGVHTLIRLTGAGQLVKRLQTRRAQA